MLFLPPTLPHKLTHGIQHANAGLVTNELNKDPRFSTIVIKSLDHTKNQSWKEAHEDFFGRLQTCRYMDREIKRLNSKLSFQNIFSIARQSVQNTLAIVIHGENRTPNNEREVTTSDTTEIIQEHKRTADVFIKAIATNDMLLIIEELVHALKTSDESFFELLPDMVAMLSREQVDDLFDPDTKTKDNFVDTMLTAYPSPLACYEVILQSLKKLCYLDRDVIAPHIEKLLKQKVGLKLDPQTLSPLQRFLKRGEYQKADRLLEVFFNVTLADIPELDFYYMGAKDEDSLQKTFERLKECPTLLAHLINSLLSRPYSMSTICMKLLKENSELRSRIKINALTKDSQNILLPLLSPTLIKRAVDTLTVDERSDLLFDLNTLIFKNDPKALLEIPPFALALAFRTEGMEDKAFEVLRQIKTPSAFAAITPMLGIEDLTLKIFGSPPPFPFTPIPPFTFSLKDATLEQKKSVVLEIDVVENLDQQLKDLKAKVETLTLTNLNQSERDDFENQLDKYLRDIWDLETLFTILIDDMETKDCDQELIDLLEEKFPGRVEHQKELRDLKDKCFEIFDTFDALDPDENCPERFISQVSFEMMEDPVIFVGSLSTSKWFADKKDIENGPGAKLNILSIHPTTNEEVIPRLDPILKTCIERWKEKNSR